MKLSVVNSACAQMSLEETLAYLSPLGVDALEVGAGGYPGKCHLDAADMVAHPEKAKEMLELFQKYNMEIAAISCHGNPLHPNKEQAEGFHNDFVNAILAAELLGVETIVGFAGCPGDSETSQNPNWVTCAWPPEYLDIQKWQWEEKVIPYWKEMAEFAKAHGIKKIAFEMHPGFVVYNPETLLRLREAVGDIIGANFDPSHLIWQGIDPKEAIKALGDAIYYFHAKDTKIDKANTGVNGVLDYKHYGDILNRSWVFRTVGYGNGKEYWNDLISTLKAVGYDGIISIEHEDGLMSVKEGLEKAVAFMKDVLIYESAGEMWWA